MSVASPSPPVAPPSPVATRAERGPVAPPLPAPGPSRDDRRFKRAVIAIGGLAVGLRALAMFAYWPAFLGYPDTSFYVSAANAGFGADPFRPGGYATFLSVVHGLGITGTVLLQHAMGLACAVLLFLTVRRLGASRWAALIPAAAVSLCGSQVMMEHALLSESLFTFLLTAALYACVRSLDDGLGWALAAGLLIGVASPIRLVALGLIPVMALWLLFAARRRRLVLALGFAAVAAAIPIAWESTSDLTRTGAYNLYGRIGPFADCKKFDPPQDTELLCEDVPPKFRRSTYFYIFEGGSPAVAYFGHPQGYPEPDDIATDILRRFSRAAIIGQPVDYARTVAKDSFRYISPMTWQPPPADAKQTPEELSLYYTTPGWSGTALREARAYYAPDTKLIETGFLLDVLRTYERWTRFSGVWFVLILIPALAAPFLARGRQRAGALLFLAAGAALLIVPAATVFYDYRFAIPALASWSAAAAFGAPVLRARWTRRRRVGRIRPAG